MKLLLGFHFIIGEVAYQRLKLIPSCHLHDRTSGALLGKPEIFISEHERIICMAGAVGNGHVGTRQRQHFRFVEGPQDHLVALEEQTGPLISFVIPRRQSQELTILPQQLESELLQDDTISMSK